MNPLRLFELQLTPANDTMCVYKCRIKIINLDKFIRNPLLVCI